MFTDNTQTIAESTSWPASDILLNVLPKPPRKSENFETIDSRKVISLPANGFYHWLIEDLAPFLNSFQSIVNPLVLIYKRAPRYVSSLLETAGIEVIEVPRFIFLRSYTFTSKGPDTGWPHPQDIKVLRSFFPPSYCHGSPVKRFMYRGSTHLGRRYLKENCRKTYQAKVGKSWKPRN